MKQILKLNSLQELNNSLASLQPNNSETTQIITYALLGVALTGIMFYHYVKEQEKEGVYSDLSQNKFSNENEVSIKDAPN